MVGRVVSAPVTVTPLTVGWSRTSTSRYASDSRRLVLVPALSDGYQTNSSSPRSRIALVHSGPSFVGGVVRHAPVLAWNTAALEVNHSSRGASTSAWTLPV